MPSAPPGKVRIIAGRWRNTRLPVPDQAGLRPTSERVRETLFNWLQGSLSGTCCLDLFAGSGALGLEALSRGAGQALLIEHDRAQAARLQALLDRLGDGGRGMVLATDALAWLAAGGDGRRFDLIFLDPPFALSRWSTIFAGIGPLLAEDARVYVESARSVPLPIPAHWRLLREGVTRQVRYALYAARTATLASVDGAITAT